MQQVIIFIIHVHFTIIQNSMRQKIFSFEKLEAETVWHFQ